MVKTNHMNIAVVVMQGLMMISLHMLNMGVLAAVYVPHQLGNPVELKHIFGCLQLDTGN